MSAARYEWEKAVRDDVDDEGQPMFVKADLAILLAMATYADAQLECFPSRQRLAAVTGYSTGQVGRTLQRARELGYIHQLRRGGRSGDGATRASEHQLVLPCRPRIPARSTSAQPRRDARKNLPSSAQTSGLNRAKRAPQPRTHERPTDHVQQAIDQQRSDEEVVHSSRLPDDVIDSGLAGLEAARAELRQVAS